ncbi:MAG TPA: hypothetical protein VIV11_18605 [Kofleriaceae bacterium]
MRGGIVLVATVLACGPRTVEAPLRPPSPAPAVAGHIVMQGAPPVPVYRVPSLLWQSGPHWSGLVRSLGTELVIQDPASGAIRERIPTAHVPYYFGVTTDGAVLCVAQLRWAIDLKGPMLKVDPQKLLGGWSLAERRWLWQREDRANGLLVGDGRCGFVRNVGEPDAHGFYQRELVVTDARTGETIGAPKPLSIPGMSETTLQVSGDGRWALYPATTQVGYSDGQKPAWALYRVDDFTIAARWSGPCAGFDARGRLLLDDATRAQRAEKLAKLELTTGTCTPLPTHFGPAGLFAPAPDISSALTMQMQRNGIELALRDRDGTLRTRLTTPHEVAGVAATRDGSRVFVVEGGTLREWKLSGAGGPTTIATGVTSEPCLDRDDRTLAWIAGGALHRYDLADAKDTTLALPASSTATWRCSVGPSGAVAVLASGAQTTLSIADGTSWRTIDLDRRTDIRGFVFAGDRLVVLDKRGLRAWSTNGKLNANHDGAGLALATSSDDTTVATVQPGDSGTKIQLVDAAKMSPRASVEAAVFGHSIRALEVGADAIAIAGSPTMDGCDAERCFIETRAIGGGGAAQLAPLDGLGSVSFTSSLLVQAAVDRRGVRVMSRDGHTRVTFGSIGDGWFAYEPHGHFACGGDGCAAFRCAKGNALTEATTCAGDRADGLGKLFGNR